MAPRVIEMLRNDILKIMTDVNFAWRGAKRNLADDRLDCSDLNEDR